MRKATLAAAALLCAVAAVPSFAAVDRLGWVHFSQRDTHDARLGNFKAESMAMIARGSDVVCDHVVATYGNGRQGEIFHGALPEGEAVKIHLPQSSVDRVDFDCRPTGSYRASVDLAADDGKYAYDRYDRSDDQRYTYNRYDRSDDERYAYNRYDRYDDRPSFPDER
jgi:hypothetical protein